MAKPRGRPPADGNWITWTEPMVAGLLQLRFEQFAVQLSAARGTKSLKQAWADLAAELSRQNGGNTVSVEQCRNKLKALKNKWLAYHAGGIHSKPVCLELMDVYWASNRDHVVAPTPVRHPRPSTETSPARSTAKRQRVETPASSAATPPTNHSTPSSMASSTPTLTPIAPAPVITTTASPAITTGTPAAVASSAKLLDVGMQAISQGFTDIASAAAEATCSTASVDSAVGDPVSLTKLLDRRLAQVVERQDQQLRQTEMQTQLLLRLVTSLERQHGHPDPLG